FGDGVNIASRLQSVTDPGGIYLTESLQKSIRAKTDIQTKFLGEFILKNVGYPLRTYAILGEGLPAPSTANIKKLIGRTWKEKLLRSVYTYIILLALLLSNGWWIRKAFFIKTSQISSLLVLPFDNFTGSDTLEYFVAGMPDALIGDVGKISALRVPSKRTANAYRDVDKSIPEIASELGIDAAVETSVSCFGDNICFQVRLVSAFPEETQLWVEDFYIEKSELSNLSKRLAKEISEQINVLLTPNEEKMLADSRPIDPDAYEAYLRGISYVELGTEADLEKAMDYFERALEIDQDYALAYHGISFVWGSRANHGFVPAQEANPKREVARKKALELDSSLVEIRASMATEMTWALWNWENAGKEF
ncbi:MAG: hypothetical protein KAK04_05745, partial [Cyclobacteriaceae bacterium]|nr:hypothetical protein [Cyclobacteriaceae bacterium]